MKHFVVRIFAVRVLFGSGLGAFAAGANFTLLHTFTNSPDGADPIAGLVLCGNTLYGTTFAGGSNDNGLIFGLNTDGTGFTNLYSFSAVNNTTFTNVDGASPTETLVLANGTLYGTAENAGAANGTVFSLGTNRLNFTNLLNFTGPNGSGPQCILALGGNTLYGTAFGGGTNGYGTLFRVNTDGTGYTNLYTFSKVVLPGPGTNTDGGFPNGGLVLSGHVLYGGANGGGFYGIGTIFRLNTDGTGFTNLFNFDPALRGTNTDGGSPSARFVLSGNTLYGTASAYGPQSGGTVFRLNTDGSGFQMLHAFASPAIPNATGDGSTPLGGLVLSGSTLYGTTRNGGAGGHGTVYQINTNGSGYAILYSFLGGNDGAWPEAELFLAGHTLYGMAESGGGNNLGTVFSLTLPAPLQILQDASFGIQAGAFGFDFCGVTGQTVAVEATTNMLSGAWVPLQTNVLGAGAAYFSDPNWTNFPGRFYRVHAQ